MRPHGREVGAGMCAAALAIVTHAAPPAGPVESWFYMATSLGLLIGGRKLMRAGR